MKQRINGGKNKGTKKLSLQYDKKKISQNLLMRMEAVEKPLNCSCPFLRPFTITGAKVERERKREEENVDQRRRRECRC